MAMHAPPNHELEQLYRRLHALVPSGSDLHDVLETTRYLRAVNMQMPPDTRLASHHR